MRTRAHLWLLPASLALFVGLLASCGGNGDDDDSGGTPAPSVTSTLVVPTAVQTTETPIEALTVAFINLYSPLTLDRTDPVAGETFERRLAQVVQEVKQLDPDLVAFSEASWTQHGNAIERLQVELDMEFAWGPANPGFGLERPAADEEAARQGWQEGELLFSRHKILHFERIFLNPRSSELGEGRIALHAILEAPEPLGEFNVFLTHLTGGGPEIRAAQAADLIRHIQERRRDRPTLLIGDMGDPVESATYEAFRQAGFTDPAWERPLPTCCRTNVVGAQPELTSRSDCIMALGFGEASVQLFAHHPVTGDDGTQLYASDHNGLLAVFSIEDG
jgi:endonuclease/exonuclease/phosphatase family metal-dependent hydrolase